MSDSADRRRRWWLNGVIGGTLAVVLAGVTVLVVTQLLTGAPSPSTATAPRSAAPTPVPTPTMDPFVSG